MASSATDALERMVLSVYDKKPYNFVIVDHAVQNEAGEDLIRILKSDQNFHKSVIVYNRSGESGAADVNCDIQIDKSMEASEVHKLFLEAWKEKDNQKKLPLVDKVKTSSKTEVIKWTDKTVLLVEDNSVNQMVATKMLHKLIDNIDVASDGLEAIQLFCKNSYDIIYMDLQMPSMDGLEATQKIRELECENDLEQTFIIAMTANAMAGDREICLEAGMDDYITKPIVYEKLKGSLIKYLASNTSEDQVFYAASERALIDYAKIEELKEITGGDLEFLHELINAYILQAEEILGAFDPSIKDDGLSKLKFNLHSLKGISYNVGASYIGDLCSSIESDITDEAFDVENAAFDQLGEAFAKTKEEMLKLLSQ